MHLTQPRVGVSGRATVSRSEFRNCRLTGLIVAFAHSNTCSHTSTTLVQPFQALDCQGLEQQAQATKKEPLDSDQHRTRAYNEESRPHPMSGICDLGHCIPTSRPIPTRFRSELVSDAVRWTSSMAFRCDWRKFVDKG